MTQREILLVTAAIIIALSGTWVLSQWRQQQAFTEALNQPQVNTYMSQFSAYATDTKGSPKYTLTAEHSTSQHRNKLTQIYQPRYIMATKTGNINISSQKATENKQGDIELTNDVIIRKKASETKVGYQLITEHLLYSPSNQEINTNKAVKITTSSHLTIQSIGLNENLSTQITRLKSKVHTNYAPPIQNISN